MPTIEERVARLEEKADHSTEKIDTLFEKLDKLIDRMDKFTTIMQNMELTHKACAESRKEGAGWLQGRFTKIVDAFLMASLIVLLLMLLKNAPMLIPLLGG